MDISSVNSPLAPAISNRTYKIIERGGEEITVHPSRNQDAFRIDTDRDQILSEGELVTYLQKKDILRDPSKYDTDQEQILSDYKLTLQNKELPQTKAYHSYDEVVSELKALENKYPDKAKMVSLGKTAEGRDIWAIKIGTVPPPPEESQETQWLRADQPAVPQEPQETKPGVVITGGTHAREWIGNEVALFVAQNMLELSDSDSAMKERIGKANVWVVPVVNPDGYEYSRTKDSWWRKNRQPVTVEVNKEGNIAGEDKAVKKGIGVDLNRNYGDGTPEHMHLYRPPGDTPQSTWDDQGASDYLTSDQYRGTGPCSEKETQAIAQLQLNPKNNIKGGIDFHSYGRMILFPWGHNYDKAENYEEYKSVGESMAKIIRDYDGVQYKPMQSSDLYPATGSSEDFQHVNGIMSYTIELERSFAPNDKEIAPTQRRLFGAQMFFIDHIVNKHTQA